MDDKSGTAGYVLYIEVCVPKQGFYTDLHIICDHFAGYLSIYPLYYLAEIPWLDTQFVSLESNFLVRVAMLGNQHGELESDFLLVGVQDGFIILFYFLLESAEEPLGHNIEEAFYDRSNLGNGFSCLFCHKTGQFMFVQSDITGNNYS